MLLHLIRKELLDHLLSPRFAILGSLGAIVIAFSFYDGVAYYREVQRTYDQASAATEGRVRRMKEGGASYAQGEWYWGEVFGVGHRINRRPSPLVIFVRGLDPVLGRSMSVNGGYTENRLRVSATSETPLLDVFPSADLDTIVSVVLALFVLLLSFDALCGEKENRTMSLTFSHAVPRLTFLAAKFVGVLLPVLVSFGIPILLGACLLPLVSEAPLTVEHWLRLAATLAAFVVYLATMLAGGLLASSLSQRPATSLVYALVLWVGIAVVLPRFSLITAGWIREAPSVTEYEGRKRSAFWEPGREGERRIEEWMASYGTEHPRPPRPGGIVTREWIQAMQAYQDTYNEALADTRERMGREQLVKSEALLRRAREDYENAFNAWFGLARNLARVSPAFSMHHAATLLSGTGLAGFEKFLAASEQFARTFAEWTGRVFIRDTRIRARDFWGLRWNISDMPRFSGPPTFGVEAWLVAIFDVAAVLVWGILFLGLASLSLLRYDLR